MHLAIRRECWQMVLMLQLVQGGLAGCTLSTPTQGPKGEVASILGSQHAAGLAPLTHAQGNARPYKVVVSHHNRNGCSESQKARKSCFQEIAELTEGNSSP